MRRSAIGIVALTVSMLLANGSVTTAQSTLPLNTIRLPAGFKIALYASGIPDARSMTLGDNGTLFVGSRQGGKVYAITGQTQATQVQVIASGLDQPNGVAFLAGSLYIAEQTRVIRMDNIEANLANPPRAVVVNSNFPSQPLHGWKFIRFGPDGKLYVPIGVPCDICQTDPNRYGMIARMNPVLSSLEPYVNGIRNTVGFDWQPGTNNLWFTDNANDKMGDNTPPDTLNDASQPTMN